ncbi:MAG: ATP-binding protein [Candidatus Saccharibacteria bacterium]|nr:ATP-binding protein [Rhodoferax sp.]
MIEQPSTQNWRKFGPPQRYASVSFDDFKTYTPALEDAVDKVFAFPYSGLATDTYEIGARGFDNLLIVGTPGTGKTMLAAMWLRDRMVDDEEQGQFLTSYQLGDAALDSPEVKRASTVQNLVLDDIAADSRDLDAVVRILDQRLARELRTVLTSNARPDELKEIYGPRGFSRIFCNALVVLLNGTDYRLKQLKD